MMSQLLQKTVGILQIHGRVLCSRGFRHCRTCDLPVIMRALSVDILCRAASETSIATAYRLAETLAAHGSTEALDMDAAMQVAHVIFVCIAMPQCARQVLKGRERRRMLRPGSGQCLLCLHNLSLCYGTWR